MNLGISELIAIFAVVGGVFAWINNEIKFIDKRLDGIEKDINGIGSRLSLFELGTCELLGEQINHLRTKLIDLENSVSIGIDSKIK